VISERRRKMRFRNVAARWILGALLCSFCSAEEAVRGNIKYPAVGNLDLAEGTIESWIRLDFDPYEFKDTTFWLRSLCLSVAFAPKDQKVQSRRCIPSYM
jgi:hypothetical protein